MAVNMENDGGLEEMLFTTPRKNGEALRSVVAVDQQSVRLRVFGVEAVGELRPRNVRVQNAIMRELVARCARMG